MKYNNDNDMYVTKDGNQFEWQEEAFEHEFKKEISEVKETLSKLAIKLQKNKELMDHMDDIYDAPSGPEALISFILEMPKLEYEAVDWKYYNSYGS